MCSTNMLSCVKAKMHAAPTVTATKPISNKQVISCCGRYSVWVNFGTNTVARSPLIKLIMHCCETMWRGDAITITVCPQTSVLRTTALTLQTKHLSGKQPTHSQCWNMHKNAAIEATSPCPLLGTQHSAPKHGQRLRWRNTVCYTKALGAGCMRKRIIPSGAIHANCCVTMCWYWQTVACVWVKPTTCALVTWNGLQTSVVGKTMHLMSTARRASAM